MAFYITDIHKDSVWYSTREEFINRKVDIERGISLSQDGIGYFSFHCNHSNGSFLYLGGAKLVWEDY